MHYIYCVLPFYTTHHVLGLACGLKKTVTETSVQCGKEAWMEVVNKIMGGPRMD